MRVEINVLIFVFFVGFLQSQVNGNVRSECRKATGVSWVSLKKLKRSDLNEVDQKLKCYLKCFMVKNGVISDKNEVEMEKTLRHLPRKLQDGSRTVLKKCKEMRGENSCDTAFQIAKCYFEAYPEVMIKLKAAPRCREKYFCFYHGKNGNFIQTNLQVLQSVSLV